MKNIHAFGSIWLDWIIDEKIGIGSFGTVWKAHQEDKFCCVNQYAAIKHISIPTEVDMVFPSEETKGNCYHGILDQLIY